MIFAQIIILLYSFVMVFAIITWAINEESIGSQIEPQALEITVIAALRNEEKNVLNLLKSLESQLFSKKCFEIILVNDNSTDKTVEKIELYIQNSKLNIQILHLPNFEIKSSPKKQAITLALSHAKGKYIFCTDGDCILPPRILDHYFQIFEQNNSVKFISGPVTFFENSSNHFWNNLQIVEFASLIGTAAVSIFNKKPNMCSGANIAYRKDVFLEVKGYEGNEMMASGDDEFLMQKIFAKYNNGMKYCKSTDCIVETHSCESVGSFISQRKRWSSKWNSYAGLWPTILAVFIFSLNLAFLILIFYKSWPLVYSKILVEFVFLSLILGFLKRTKAIFYIPIVQVIYPFYVLYFGFLGLFGDKAYQWKNRSLK